MNELEKIINTKTDKTVSAHRSFEDSLLSLMSLADKKGLSVIKGIPRKVARLDSLFADADLKLTIKDFASYIDPQGIKGSDPKGLMIQINTKIKTLFGFSVSHEMDANQSAAIANARRQAARVCADGKSRNQGRAQIRERIYKTIETCAKHFHEQEEILK